MGLNEPMVAQAPRGEFQSDPAIAAGDVQEVTRRWQAALTQDKIGIRDRLLLGDD